MADRPEPFGAPLSRTDYFQQWSQLHGGVDPETRRLVSMWLTLMYSLARPLVRIGWSPNAVTTLGLFVAVVALGAATQKWWWLAAALIVVSGLFDGLDGAVAVMTGRTSAWGYVWDSLADRFADVALLLVLWLLGAPAWMCVVIGVTTFALEYTRARASAAGMSEVGVISVWERPTRVIVVGMFTLAAAVANVGWLSQVWAGVDVALVGTIAAGVSLVLAAVGFFKVVLVVRQHLR